MTKSNYLVNGLKLLLVCLISAGSLTYIYTKTKPEIERMKREKLLKLQRELLPLAVSFRDLSETLKEGIGHQGEVVGFIAVVKTRGYADIEMAVGVNKDGSVAGVRVLKHTETPGLGTKALTEEFLKQFLSKKSEQLYLKIDDPESGTVDSITGATITSRAITKGIREAIEKVNK